ncbi:unnamed protein product [Diamesa hyperborea]
MKLILTLCVIVSCLSTINCRPQTVQVEKQDLMHLHRLANIPLTSESVKRGSIEETQRILQEIERINNALGYRKKISSAYPRQQFNSEGYFYPRQEFKPAFLTKKRVENSRSSSRNIHSQRAIYASPFNNQQYYYPTPYLQVPTNQRAEQFTSNKYFYPVFMAQMNGLQYNDKDEKRAEDGSIKLGTIVILPKEHYKDRAPKAVESEREEIVKKINKLKDQKKHEVQPSFIDQFVNYVPDALGFAEDDDEDERQQVVVSSTTPRQHPIKNDKFLNLAVKKRPSVEVDEDDDDDDDDETEDGEIEYKEYGMVPSSIQSLRAFNFTNPIEKLQNFTKQFTQTRTQDLVKEQNDAQKAAIEIAIIREREEDAADDKEDKEEEKSPFGLFPFGPKQQSQTFKEGGIIIQRLKVRRGGIAIAGPGGVATAGSGGTAIVGPNGIAFTHPRSLAIGGPGAKIYAVPESTDLEALALNHSARNLNLEIGQSSADQPINGYDSYFPESAFQQPGSEPESTLILEPHSKAIVGNDGTAISSPISRAILRRGTAVKVLFKPQSVAIAGNDKILMPYYGGAKGQVLEIRQRPDGTIFSRILMDEVKTDIKKEDLQEPEMSKALPRPQASFEKEEITFENSLLAIQRAAAELVHLQESFKETGKLTDEQKKIYSKNLENLGLSAQKLANVQQEDGDDYRLLFDESMADRIKAGGSKKKPENIKFPPYAKKPQTTTPKKEECGETVEKEEEEENVGEEGDDSSTTAATTTTTKAPPPSSSSDGDSVSVSAAEEESSVAEAKPVGLAIAGVGGVASSKPIATAIVGPGGLAVARPVATAIAGIKPSEVSALGLPIPGKLKDLVPRGSLPLKGKYGLASISNDDNDKVLVGPNYFAESRLAEKGIDSYPESYQNEDDIEAEENENMKQSNKDEEKAETEQGDNERQVEPVDNLESEYGFDFGKSPLMQQNFEGMYNWSPNPYMQQQAYMPIPMNSQFLQRRGFNTGLRYPSAPQYPSAYNPPQYDSNPTPYAPFRYYIVQ